MIVEILKPIITKKKILSPGQIVNIPAELFAKLKNSVRPVDHTRMEESGTHDGFLKTPKAGAETCLHPKCAGCPRYDETLANGQRLGWCWDGETFRNVAMLKDCPVMERKRFN
jgi:hypothetical protein